MKSHVIGQINSDSAPVGGVLQRKCVACNQRTVAGDKCSECGKKNNGSLQRAATSAEAINGAPPIVHEALRSSGRPLDAATREFMEPRFRHDFSGVRVHTDSQAAESARAVNALAYTMGRDVVFGAGRYAPGTTAGKKLLAHELAHTIQQAGSGSVLQGKLNIGDANDRYEREADQAGENALSGAVQVELAGASRLQRTIGDGHDLTAARFAGDVVLEAVYDNERLLKDSDKGAAVRKLQQALVDSGFSLPIFGVDGDFGSETKAAVEAFQRASGLTGANIDGIVGPTTMGWLDQRFSAGPTPAGTTPGATTGCAAFRTFNVDMVSLDGSTRPPIADLDFANTVFSQCCVRFAFAGGGSESAPRTTALLGGDTDLDNTGPCGSATVEETGLFSGATADFGLSSAIRIFYVASLSSGDRAYSIPAFCATGASAGLSGMAAVSNSAMPRSLTHELGHILLNSGVHPADTNNLMNPTNTATGEQLETMAQCATI
ncbi:MAG: eCIS core domain-containing protein [Blastocatellia bacterium]